MPWYAWLLVFIFWLGCLVYGIADAIPYGGSSAPLRIAILMVWAFFIMLAYKVMAAIFRWIIDAPPQQEVPKVKPTVAAIEQFRSGTKISARCGFCNSIFVVTPVIAEPGRDPEAYRVTCDCAKSNETYEVVRGTS